MKVIRIGNKDYKFEFTIEASLYGECTETLTGFLTNISSAQGKQDLKELIKSVSDIPQTALTLFYAGLLENHGEDGDGTVLCKKDAKRLIKQYFEDNKDTENADFYSVMALMMEVMEEDGFFKRTGLERMLTAGEKTPKKPQGHKKPIKVTQK